jgi:uncharacterized membrane protein (DUF4010 family)
MALKLATLIAIIGLVANIVVTQVGDSGLFTVAALSGLADVDAVTLSFARMTGGALALETAALAVLIAITANTVAKTCIAAWLGGRAFGALVGLVNIATLATMYAAWWLLPSAVAVVATLP